MESIVKIHLQVNEGPRTTKTTHCPKNTLNLREKPQPVMVGAGETVYIWRLNMWKQKHVSTEPAVTGSILDDVKE